MPGMESGKCMGTKFLLLLFILRFEFAFFLLVLVQFIMWVHIVFQVYIFWIFYHKEKFI